MKREIGSFFEAYEEPVDRQTDSRDFPLWQDAPNVELVCSGREAIEAALVDIQNRNPGIKKVCLLPQYTCDTVIIPFQKHEWKSFFYPVTRSLTVDADVLKALLSQIRPSVLLMHTYYGADTLRMVRPLISELRARNALVFIEDMTQSLGLWDSSRTADYLVGSLRKWFPIPDGGFVSSSHPINVQFLGEKREFVHKKAVAQKMKLEYLREWKAIEKEELLRQNSEAEQYLYENDQISRVSDRSKKLLKKMDINGILSKRKENAEYLRGLMEQSGRFSIAVPAFECEPLYLPIYAENRERLQKWLKEADIFAPVLWPVPACVEAAMTADVRFIFDHLLALPCDQRYDKKDMKRIYDRLCEF